MSTKAGETEKILEKNDTYLILETNYGTHKYEEKYILSELFCPYCGERDVWIEDSPGDYYVGPSHKCLSCDEEFYLQ